MKKRIIIVAGSVVIVFICALLFIRFQYSKANQLLLSSDYESAIEKYSISEKFGLGKNEKSIAEMLLDGSYIDAVEYADNNVSNQEIVSYVQENCYQKMLEAIQNGDYIEAQKCEAVISGYKDTSSLSEDINNHAVYQQAEAAEKESLQEAVLLYEKLPEDFLDVNEKLTKFKPFMEYIGKKYGDEDGYITEYLEIEDFIYDQDTDKIMLPAWGNSEVQKSSMDGYDYEALWKQYDRTVFFNMQNALIQQDSEQNLLSTDGSVKQLGESHKSTSSERTCPNCGGTGVVRYYYGEGSMDFDYGTCTMCDGTGVVY